MKRFIQVIVFILLIGAFIFLGTRNYDKNKQKVNIKNDVTSDVLINLDNSVFTEINHSQVLSKLSSSNSSIIYACFDGNKLCGKYGKILNDVARENNINDIYYYDFLKDRRSNNATYMKIVEKLSNYLPTNDLGKQDLHAPTLVVIKKGNVYYYDDSLSSYRGSKTIDEYFNQEKQDSLRYLLGDILKGYSINE